MYQEYLPLILAVLVGVTYYFSNRINFKNKSYYHKLMSFSAGVSITYVLLEFFPTFTKLAISINQFLFIAVLFGFISHHVIEKYIYQHNSRHDLVKTLTLEENTFSFVYHIILGMVLVTFTQQSSVEGVLFFVTMVSYTFVASLPSKPHKSIRKAVMLSSSTLLGAILAKYVWTFREIWIEAAFMGIALGVLLFTVVRHHIPFGRKGRVSYFTLGFATYAILIIGSWFI